MTEGLIDRAKIIKLLLCVTLPLYILDQLTKWWVVFNFELPYKVVNGVKVGQPEDTHTVIEGFFNLVRRHNQGVAFGIGNGTTWAPIVFLFVLIIALVLISYFWRKGAFTGPAKWAAPLLLSGVLGNLTDRLCQGFMLEPYKNEGFLKRLSEGYVVDFLDFKIPGFEKIMPSSGGHWPAFNVADSCITISAVLLFLTAIMEAKSEMRDKKAAQKK